MENATFELENIGFSSQNMPTNVDSRASGSTPSHAISEDSAGGKCWLVIRKLIPSRGMLTAILSSLLFSCVDVTVALATEEVNPHLVLSIYTCVVTQIVLVCIFVKKINAPGNGKPYAYLLAGGGMFGAGITFLTLAISKIPVGDAVSIFSSRPIFAGPLGWILLKQRLRVVDIFFSILCIAGVVVIARPSFIFKETPDEHIDITGALYAVAAAVSLSVSFTFGRKLTDLKVHLMYIVLSNAGLTFAINAVLCSVLKLWGAPSPTYYWIFCLLPGCFDFSAQLLLFFSLKLERTVTVAIILTSEILFAYVLQILIIHIIPHWYSAIGAFCILVSCIGMATRKERTDDSQNHA